MKSSDAKSTPPVQPVESEPSASGGSLIGRLIVVPAILVTLAICLAIVVVLFGGASVGQRPSIDELLRTIETGGGKYTAGVMLFPADREVWQAAQELATRLSRKEREVPPDQIEPTTARIARALSNIKPSGARDDSAPAKRRFLMLALARLGSPSAVDTIASFLDSPDAMERQSALAALMELKGEPSARRRVPDVLARLDDDEISVQIVACAAVSVLADRSDPAAVRALRQKLAGDREVQWNAALGLARLGSNTGKVVLLNMLDRGFWEKNRVQYQSASETVDRPFSATEIQNYLVVAIEASAGLNDSDLRASILKLAGDPALPVREAARTALAGANDEPKPRT